MLFFLSNKIIYESCVHHFEGVLDLLELLLELTLLVLRVLADYCKVVVRAKLVLVKAVAEFHGFGECFEEKY